MSKKPTKRKDHKLARNKSILAANQQPSSPTGLRPWISYKNSLVLITVCSLGMGGLTAFQIGPVGGWGKGVLYGLLYGALVWGVFLLSLLVFRWIRKKQDL